MRYDDDGNLVSVTSTDLSADVDTYENGNLIKSVTGGYGTFEYTYDETYTHRLVSATNGQLTQTMGYDGVGNVTSSTLSGNGTQTITTSAAYDSNGNRLLSVTDATGAMVSYAYADANSQMLGLPTSVTDPKGTVTATAYDTFGRVSQISVENWAELDYTYSNGNLSAITRTEDDDTAQTYRFTYDAFGNALSASVGSRTLATYEYESGNGLLKKQTYGNGDAVSFTYDDLGRARTVTYDDGTTVSYVYNGEGAVYSITEKQGANTTLYLYTYDSIGRLIACEKKVNGTTTLRTYQEFNEHNRQTLYGYQMGDVSYAESYEYNSDGTLKQITCGDTGINYAYDSLCRLNGRVLHVDSATVVTEIYGYKTDTTQITSQRINSPTGSMMYQYYYDSNGNITAYVESAAQTLMRGTTLATTYTYDSMNQLVRENNPVAQKTWTWVYDNAGNILSRNEYPYTTASVEGVTPVDTVTYTYGDSNWSDLLTSYDGNTITYDEIGNPLNDGTWSYSWENGRQLASMTDGTTTWNYEYDANGMRTSRTNGTTTYKYVYNGGQLIQMTIGSTPYQLTYDANGRPASITYRGATYYYVTNLQGDVVMILNSDGAAVVVYDYDAWGNIVFTSGSMASTLGVLNPLRYRGYVYDSESGLYYLQSRYYDPEMGRFINADSYASTGQGILGNNMFAYCLNNPIVYTDDVGEIPAVVLPLWDYWRIHKMVQQDIVLYWGYEMEVYVKSGNKRGFLDLYDVENNQYYEVKHAPAASTAKEQMDKYDVSHIADWRFWGHTIEDSPTKGNNIRINGSFSYSCYTVTYRLTSSGLITYSVEYSPAAIAALAAAAVSLAAGGAARGIDKFNTQLKPAFSTK